MADFQTMRSCLLTLVAALVPLFLLSFSTGPGPGRTGAPGDTGHCAGGSCHNGAALPNEGIELHFPNGPFYRPGVRQRLLVTVTGETREPDRGVFGFQLTPRGGRLEALTDGRTRVSRFSGFDYIEHRRPSPERSWEVDWDPPATSDGPVQFYVAANAANDSGDGFGDQIYLRSFTARPAGPLSVRQPFGGGSLSPEAWVEIYGTQLAGARAVQVGGRAAAIAFRGASQINVRLSAETPVGWQMLEVESGDGSVVTSPVWVQASSLSLFPRLEPLSAGQVAVWYGTGCGHLTGPAPALVRLGPTTIAANANASPDQPGLCQVQFAVPELPRGELAVQACLGDHCNAQRISVTIR